MATEYALGQVVRLTATIRDVDGALVTPTAVTARVRDPSDVTTSTAASSVSLGVYYVDVTASAAGTWYYRFTSTGPVTAGEGSFDVLPTNVP